MFDLRIEPEDVQAVAAVYRSGRLGAGEEVEAFERAFAVHLGVRHAVALSSATAALHLAYLAAGVGPGDEVIVPSFTFVATASAVRYCGAQPVFADVLGPHDLSVDPEHVESLVTGRTKAVVAVHFAGYAAPVASLAALCARHGLALVEDAAHAPAASVGGRCLGTWGTAGCFSFFSNKVLSCGEGGLLATDSDDVAAYARARRVPDAFADGSVGFNYGLDEPRAALLRSRLARLAESVRLRRVLVRRYREHLARLDGIVVPYRDDDVDHSSAYVMPVLLRELERQSGFRRLLRERHGVQTSLLYPAVHEFTAYREGHSSVSLPHTERAARTEVTLPLFPHMSTDAQDRVIAAVEAALGT